MLVVGAGLALAGLSLGCGHTIHARHTQGQGPFDFRSPPCSPPAQVEADDDDLVMRYLGVAGVYIRWRGSAVMTAPFFSNPGMARVLLGRFEPNHDRINGAFRRTPVPLEEVGAILVGHAHYDHMGDVPFIARELARGAQIYVNATGAASLAAEDELRGRVTVVEPGAEWIQLQDAADEALPIRVLPIRSLHAPHVGSYTWAKGERRYRAERPLTGQRFHHMRAGTTLAYIIDFLSEEGETQFRIYFQDSVNDGDWGYPPSLGEEHGFDLAILCMASYHLVPGSPERLLEALNPRHVLITHFENFFRDPARPTVFVPFLTNRRANHFLDRVQLAGEREGNHEQPTNEICGPSSPFSTMPVVGDWLVMGPQLGRNSSHQERFP